AGTLVGLGDYSVQITVADASGNTNSCSTLLRVVDTTPPAILSGCSATLTLSVATNCQAAVPDLTSSLVVSDNYTRAGSLHVSQNPPAGTLLGLGDYSVQITVADASGNSNSCSGLLRVVDTTAPAILDGCSATLTLSAATNCQAVVPDLTSHLVVSDN